MSPERPTYPQNRVAMRFLCGHYLALSSPPREGFVGLVQRGVSLTNIAQAAAMEAASICCHALGACPEIRMSVDRSGDGLVAAVPEYVHYVVLELLKNAMRATMQAHGKGDTERQGEVLARGGGGDGDGRGPIVFADVPEVSISVRKQGEDDVLLVVGDHGGGIPAEATDKVTYALCAVLFWSKRWRALSWAEWYLRKRLVFTAGRSGGVFRSWLTDVYSGRGGIAM